MKLIINNIGLNSLSIFFSSNLFGSKNYASMLQESSSQIVLFFAKLIMNKKQIIIIGLNNQSYKATFKDIHINTIIKNLNICIKSLENHLIRAVKQLFSKNIAVFIININATDKLHSNNR